MTLQAYASSRRPLACGAEFSISLTNDSPSCLAASLDRLRTATAASIIVFWFWMLVSIDAAEIALAMHLLSA